MSDVEDAQTMGTEQDPTANTPASSDLPPVSQTTDQPSGTLPVAFRRVDRILIQGDSESGKSHLATKIIAGARRRVIITPNADEWTAEPNRLIVSNEKQLVEGVKQCRKLGNLVCVLDDLDMLITRTENDENVNWLFMGARHRGVGWIVISRRTADIPTIVFKQANKVFLFQTDLPRDLEIYRDFYNCDVTVKGLNRVAHQCLFIDRETKKRQIIVAQP